MDDALTAAEIGFLMRSLDRKRRDYEAADWSTPKMMFAALHRVRALQAKLVALRDEIERGPER